MQASGDGPGLVLIHGWGLHGGIWDRLVPLLEPNFSVIRVDLPGHGNSVWSGEVTVDAMVERVVAAVPDTAAWLGWSMGGLVAMRAAMLHPDRVNALVTIASSPCFVRKPDWQSAMLPVLLETFAAELEQDYRRTLDRFLALQVRGSANASQVLKSLRKTLLSHGVPQVAGLRAGLEVLRNTDLRSGLNTIHCPTLMLMGGRDTLVPVGISEDLHRYCPEAMIEVVANAGHAPFIAEPEKVASKITEFLM